MSTDTTPAEPASKIDLPDHVAGEAGSIPTFDCTFLIARFDPEKDTEPHWEEYNITMQGTDRVLDEIGRAHV